ncbi:hypothetical protein ACSW29_27240 [Rhodococcus sp. GB-02]
MELRDTDDALVRMASSMAEGHTGFFVVGVGAAWVAGIESSR